MYEEIFNQIRYEAGKRDLRDSTIRARAYCNPVRPFLDAVKKIPELTIDGAESVIRYLGKYTHRIAISNYRIKGMAGSPVTYAVKDYKNQGNWKNVTVKEEEFIRRFLMHIAPQ